MSASASPISGTSNICSTACHGWHQRTHQSSSSFSLSVFNSTQYTEANILVLAILICIKRDTPLNHHVMIPYTKGESSCDYIYVYFPLLRVKPLGKILKQRKENLKVIEIYLIQASCRCVGELMFANVFILCGVVIALAIFSKIQ